VGRGGGRGTTIGGGAVGRGGACVGICVVGGYVLVVVVELKRKKYAKGIKVSKHTRGMRHKHQFGLLGNGIILTPYSPTPRPTYL